MVDFISVHDVREAPAQAQFILDFGGLSMSDTVMDECGHGASDIFEPMSAEQRQFNFRLDSLLEEVERGLRGGRPVIPDDHDDEEAILPPPQHTPEPINTMFVVPPPVVRVDNTTYRGHGNGNEDEEEYPVAQQSNAGQHRATSAPQNESKIPQNTTQDAFDMDDVSMALDVVARTKPRNARRMTPEETAARKQAARVAKRERQSIVTEADPRRADARRERASRRESTPGQKKTYRRRSGTSTSSDDDTTCPSSSPSSAEGIPVLVINKKTRTVSVSRSSPAGSLPRSTTNANAHAGPKRSRAEKNAQTSPYPRTRPERKAKKDQNKNKLPKRVDADEDADEKPPRTSVVVADADFKQMCPPRNVVENSPEMDAIAQQFERASFSDGAPAMVNNEVPAPSSPSWKAPELVEEAPARAEDVVPVHEIYNGAQSIQEYAVDYLVGDFGLDFTSSAPAYAPEVDQLWKEFPELDDEDMLYPLDPLDALDAECTRPTEWSSFDFATPSESEPEPETILEAYHLNLKQRYCVSDPMQYTYNHYDGLEYTCRYEEFQVALPDFTEVLKHIYEPKRCKAKAKMTSHGVRWQPYVRHAPVAACAAY